MAESPPLPSKEEPASAKGWGGWGISPFSMLSDIQKAASVAAEEISRNVVVVAKNAAKGIADLQTVTPDSDSDKEDREPEKLYSDEKSLSEEDKLRKSALDKLEKASEDSLMGQGLKVLDHSVENLALGAWQALDNAWKGGSNLVHKLEHSAANLADSIQHSGLPVNAGSLAPSLIETGKAITSKGIQVLELVGKETMELLITETGIEVENNPKEADKQVDEDQFSEDVTFDRCFYIYGGPEQLEELESLSNHYMLLFNTRKLKLLAEQKTFYDGKFQQLQQIFCFSTENDGISPDSDKGKNFVALEVGNDNEMEILRDSSVNKAAEMAVGFTAALGGLAANEIIQRTADRLEAIRSEGVHRLSELCCLGLTQLVMLGKSVISSASKSQTDEAMNIEWPEDPVSKAKIIRSKARSMTGDMEAVSNSFITGISDVFEAYSAAIKDSSTDVHDGLLQEKTHAISNHLHADGATAMSKIQDGLQYLTFVVLSTSMTSA